MGGSEKSLLGDAPLQVVREGKPSSACGKKKERKTSCNVSNLGRKG